MIIIVSHTTEYSYTKPVFLECHVIKLKPKTDDTQKLLNFNIQIDPKPVVTTETKDIEGNVTYNIWFEELTEKFIIHTLFEVETFRTNPFGFILDNDSQNLPVRYSEEEKQLLEVYLQRDFPESNEIELIQLRDKILKASGISTLEFLYSLNSWIYNNCKYIIREKGDPQEPEKTITKLEGSCRDMAVLFIDICRLSGIASRFVSGYQYYEKDTEKCHMHAWAEVYLPGAGWIGYDPGLGLAVAENHVIVSTAALYKNAAPVTGSFRGNDIEAKLKTEVKIDSH